jgi:hypothetical protein
MQMNGLIQFGGEILPVFVFALPSIRYWALGTGVRG